MTTKQNNQEKFLKLRKEYPFLKYEKFEIEEKADKTRVTYVFNLADKLTFKPFFEFEKPENIDLRSEKFQNLIFHIGLIELLSYWKTTCSPQIIIEPFSLGYDQIQWWKKLYFWGLGEFFYLNEIQTSQEDFVEIKTSNHAKHMIARESEKKQSKQAPAYIVPVGGGKDSAVTLEILAKNNLPITVFLLNPRPTPLKIAEIAQAEKVFTIRRVLDKQLLDLNAQGYLNGHTPFSALLAFYSVFVSELLGIEYIVLSNEASANEATIPNTKINHQYSKSLEFEQDFRIYVNRFLETNANYFSLLRPINEIQIASLLAQFPKYWDTFKSCNVGSKDDIWCCNCSKCLFTYIMLSPFITQERLTAFFGKNVLDNEDLQSDFEQLIGVADEKPFECIGTIDEVNLALQLTLKKLNELNLPFLLSYYQLLEMPKADSIYLEIYETNHFIPEHLEKLLLDELQNTSISKAEIS